MNKEHDRLMGSILVLLVCIIAVIWGTRDVEVPAAAIEASYGEEPKPQDHGK
jgi:hypothetical protein